MGAEFVRGERKEDRSGKGGGGRELGEEGRGEGGNGRGGGGEVEEGGGGVGEGVGTEDVSEREEKGGGGERMIEE